MADSSQKSGNPNIEWAEKLSAKGKKYRVGKLKSSEADDNKEASKDGSQAASVGYVRGSYDVNWPVGDSSWKRTPDDFDKNTQIYEYALFDAGGAIYEYELQIWEDGAATPNYTFYDQSGDSYSLSTWRVGPHYLDYNSDQPTIVKVDVS